MTDTEAPEARALSIPAIGEQQDGLARYQPANLKQLVWFAGEVSKSGMYLKTDASGNQVAMSQAETFMVMSEGIEMGISPLTAMRNIYLIEDRRGRKTTIPRADLIGARIQADPRTEAWEVDDSEPGRVTVSAKRRGREMVTLTLTLADIPSRDKERWAKGYLDAQEMLVNRTVRRIARRHFKDMVLGLGVDQDYDEAKVIDIAKVEQVVGAQATTPPCAECGARTRLVPTANGGAFLACDNGHTSSPPQAVRDAIRGTPEALTLAAPSLEPGEREVTDEDMQALHNAPNEEAGHGGAVAADAAVVADAQVAEEHEAQPAAEARDVGEGAHRGAPEPPVGPTLPANVAHDNAFAEAAGIGAEEPPAMSRADVDTLVTAVLRAVTAARAQGTLEAARTILRAHNWDDTPLSSWLYHHPGELPGLLHDLGAEAK